MNFLFWLILWGILGIIVQVSVTLAESFLLAHKYPAQVVQLMKEAHSKPISIWKMLRNLYLWPLLLGFFIYCGWQKKSMMEVILERQYLQSLKKVSTSWEDESPTPPRWSAPFPINQFLVVTYQGVTGSLHRVVTHVECFIPITGNPPTIQKVLFRVAPDMTDLVFMDWATNRDIICLMDAAWNQACHPQHLGMRWSLFRRFKKEMKRTAQTLLMRGEIRPQTLRLFGLD